jgi:hypothetical protein
MHALDLNGVEDLERLDVYIKDDIERYGTKLEDCHRRLKRFLADLLVCSKGLLLTVASCASGRRRRDEYLQRSKREFC